LPPAGVVSAMDADAQPQTDPSVVDWRPGWVEAMVLNVLALPLLVGALVFFALVGAPHLRFSGRAAIPLSSLLLALFAVLALIVLRFVAHEALHGVTMAAFGARPRFGAMLLGQVAPVVYTTAPGHRFTRGQYLTVALTPAVAISTAGVLACLTPAAP